MGRGPSKIPIEHGQSLFNALRVYEVAFLNDAGTIEGSLEKHLKSHKCAYVHDMSKYLLESSLIKADPKSGRNKKFYYWNGPRVSVQYCNDLYIQMKLSRSLDVKKDNPACITKDPDGRDRKTTWLDEPTGIPKGCGILPKLEFAQKMGLETIDIKDLIEYLRD